jgi:hypothetical protein
LIIRALGFGFVSDFEFRASNFTSVRSPATTLGLAQIPPDRYDRSLVKPSSTRRRRTWGVRQGPKIDALRLAKSGRDGTMAERASHWRNA